MLWVWLLLFLVINFTGGLILLELFYLQFIQFQIGQELSGRTQVCCLLSLLAHGFRKPFLLFKGFANCLPELPNWLIIFASTGTFWIWDEINFVKLPLCVLLFLALRKCQDNVLGSIALNQVWVWCFQRNIKILELLWVRV